eukprot:ctg_2462.g516
MVAAGRCGGRGAGWRVCRAGARVSTGGRTRFCGRPGGRLVGLAATVRRGGVGVGQQAGRGHAQSEPGGPAAPGAPAGSAAGAGAVGAYRAIATRLDIGNAAAAGDADPVRPTPGGGECQQRAAVASAPAAIATAAMPARPRRLPAGGAHPSRRPPPRAGHRMGRSAAHDPREPLAGGVCSVGRRGAPRGGDARSVQVTDGERRPPPSGGECTPERIIEAAAAGDLSMRIQKGGGGRVHRKPSCRGSPLLQCCKSQQKVSAPRCGGWKTLASPKSSRYTVHSSSACLRLAHGGCARIAAQRPRPASARRSDRSRIATVGRRGRRTSSQNTPIFGVTVHDFRQHVRHPASGSRPRLWHLRPQLCDATAGAARSGAAAGADTGGRGGCLPHHLVRMRRAVDAVPHRSGGSGAGVGAADVRAVAARGGRGGRRRRRFGRVRRGAILRGQVVDRGARCRRRRLAVLAGGRAGFLCDYSCRVADASAAYRRHEPGDAMCMPTAGGAAGSATLSRRVHARHQLAHGSGEHAGVHHTIGGAVQGARRRVCRAIDVGGAASVCRARATGSSAAHPHHRAGCPRAVSRPSGATGARHFVARAPAGTLFPAGGGRSAGHRHSSHLHHSAQRPDVVVRRNGALGRRCRRVSPRRRWRRRAAERHGPRHPRRHPPTLRAAAAVGVRPHHLRRYRRGVVGRLAAGARWRRAPGMGATAIARGGERSCHVVGALSCSQASLLLAPELSSISPIPHAAPWPPRLTARARLSIAPPSRCHSHRACIRDGECADLARPHPAPRRPGWPCRPAALPAAGQCTPQMMRHAAGEIEHAQQIDAAVVASQRDHLAQMHVLERQQRAIGQRRPHVPRRVVRLLQGDLGGHRVRSRLGAGGGSGVDDASGIAQHGDMRVIVQPQEGVGEQLAAFVAPRYVVRQVLAQEGVNSGARCPQNQIHVAQLVRAWRSVAAAAAAAVAAVAWLGRPCHQPQTVCRHLHHVGQRLHGDASRLQRPFRLPPIEFGRVEHDIAAALDDLHLTARAQPVAQVARQLHAAITAADHHHPNGLFAAGLELTQPFTQRQRLVHATEAKGERFGAGNQRTGVLAAQRDDQPLERQGCLCGGRLVRPDPSKLDHLVRHIQRGGLRLHEANVGAGQQFREGRRHLPRAHLPGDQLVQQRHEHEPLAHIDQHDFRTQQAR